MKVYLTLLRLIRKGWMTNPDFDRLLVNNLANGYYSFDSQLIKINLPRLLLLYQEFKVDNKVITIRNNSKLFNLAIYFIDVDIMAGLTAHGDGGLTFEAYDNYDKVDYILNIINEPFEIQLEKVGQAAKVCRQIRDLK